MPTRRSVLTLPLLATAAACAGPQALPPLPEPGPVSYRHLTRLPLNVAVVEVLPAPPEPVPAETTPSPAEAVRIMAQDRLVAVGTTGQAVFTVTAATLQRGPGRLACLVACRLEILAGGSGGRLGFVEAQAQRVVTGAEASRPRAADALLRRAMDDLNVEFEFQLRRSLADWLVPVAPDSAGGIPAPAPAEVSREDLSRP
jgi:hypothetical protein